MLKPGPELDALIAEKVMGARWFEGEGAHPPASKIRPRFSVYALCLPGEEPDTGGWEICSRPEIYTEKAIEDIPAYSTSIADAWTVIEKMRNRMWRIVWLPNNSIWQISFIDYSDIETIEEKTAPHAICLAALTAAGEKVDA